MPALLPDHPNTPTAPTAPPDSSETRGATAPLGGQEAPASCNPGAQVATAYHPAEVELPATGERHSFVRWLFEMVILVGVAFLLATGIKTFVVQPFIIPSGSMLPTLEINDRVLVNKFVYRFRSPVPGDVVVFLEPGSTRTDYIKRVVAVGGQTIDIQEGEVFVDGRAVREHPGVRGPTEVGDIEMPFTVPTGHVFLMGDNRPNSRDSRWFGSQPLERVLGEAFAIYWPIPRISQL